MQEWLAPRGGQDFLGAMATGGGKEIVAHGAAAAKFATTRASVTVIEIGGQDSKFILIDAKGAYDYAMAGRGL